MVVPMASGAQDDAAHALTAKQKSAMEAIQAAGEKKAGPVALHFAEVVKRIYENMLAEHPDEGLRVSLSDDMKTTTWELLSIKGQVIRESVDILDLDQKKIVQEEMAKPGAPSDLSELIKKLFWTNGSSEPKQVGPPR